MGQYRIQKLNSQLQKEIAALIEKGAVKDPRVSTFVTITRVDVSKDLSHAKVWVSTFLSPAQLEMSIDGLNSASGFIQTSIAKKLRLRKFPHLEFVADLAIKEAFDLVEKLNKLE